MNRTAIPVLATCLLAASCSQSANSDVSADSAGDPSASVLSSSENPVQFRARFIESHEILEGCGGFPHIAKTTAGRLFYSTGGSLGRSDADWKQFSSGDTISYGNKDIKPEVINTIPILSRTNGGKAINCAIIVDPKQASDFAYRISSNSNLNTLFMSTLMDVINKQKEIGQPVNLSWTVAPTATEGEGKSEIVESMNAAPGKRAVSGSYTTASGRYIIDPRCQDIFNPTPESSCSSPLEIDSSKLILE